MPDTPAHPVPPRPAAPVPGPPHQHADPCAAVTEALQRLQDLPRASLSEQVAVYEDVHRRLQQVLTDLGGSGG